MSSARPDNRQLLREQLIASLPQRTAETRGHPAGGGGDNAARGQDVSNDTGDGTFPMLPLQAAYYLGREVEGVACHGYLELDVPALDASRLVGALRRLVERHEGLRTIVDEGRLRVLDVRDVLPAAHVVERDLRDVADLEAALDDIRHELSHQVLPADRFPLFSLSTSRVADERWRLHLSVDVLIADAQSFEILSHELVVLYADPDAALRPLTATFSEYVDALAMRPADEVEAARDYWSKQLSELPPAPELPVGRAVGKPRFRRAEALVPESTWSAVTAVARARSVSSATAGLAAFAEVVGAWARDPRFSLNVTRFNREPVSAGIDAVDAVVGSFTDNFLVSVDLPEHETVAGTCAALQRQVWDGLEHRAVSGVEMLRESARRGGPPRVPVVFTYVGDGGSSDFRTRLGELGDVVYAVSQTPGVVLDCQLVETEQGLGVWWDYDETVLDASTVDDMLAGFVELIKDLAAEECWLRRAPARLPGSLRSLRESTESWVDTPAISLWGLVAEAARRNPDAVAVRDGALTWTYVELVRRVERVALAVRRHAGTDLVGLHLDRGAPHVACLLGIVAAGRAYLPVDTTVPGARAAEILLAGGVDLVLSDGRAPAGSWHELDAADLVEPQVTGDVEGDVENTVDADAHGSIVISPDDLAYVIFTSGSTGRPKGVRMQHGAVVNTVVDINARVALGPGDSVLAVSSPSFDLSVWDVFGTLAAAGTIVSVAPGLRAKDPLEWLERLQHDRITVWNSAPALMSLVLDEAIEREVQLPHLRMVMLSGDWIPLGLRDRLGRVAPAARLLSLGGATEAAIWSVAYEVETLDPAWTSIPYGYPLTNQSLLVLDWAGRERPVGVAGELHIGGVGVADGYWQAPEQTERAFVLRGDERVYATGDQVRRGPDGCLEILGRLDHQVKVHGHRVELAEIDAALVRCRGVLGAATQVLGPRDGHRMLASVLVLDPGTVVTDVRHEMEAVLPSYMVPTHLVPQDELPLTSNGKVDRDRVGDVVRGALEARPTPGNSASDADGDGRELVVRDEPGIVVVGPVAAAVLRLIREHTAMADLELDTNVLEAGLDSIDLVRLGGALERATGVRPALEDLLSQPTPRRVAEVVECDLASRLATGSLGAQSGADPRPPVERVDDPVDRDVLRRQLPVPVEVTGARRLGLGDPEIDPRDPVAALLHRALPVLAGRDGTRARQVPGGIGGVRCEVWLRHDLPGYPAGLHVFDPADSALVELDPGVVLDGAGLDPFVYAPVFAASPWTVAMVVDLTPYWSLYGTDGPRFASLEAGAMTQLLVDALGPDHPARVVPLVERTRLGVERWAAERMRVEQVVLLDRVAGEPELEEGVV